LHSEEDIFDDNQPNDEYFQQMQMILSSKLLSQHQSVEFDIPLCTIALEHVLNTDLLPQFLAMTEAILAGADNKDDRKRIDNAMHKALESWVAELEK
jgi:hypothetical protein